MPASPPRGEDQKEKTGQIDLPPPTERPTLLLNILRQLPTTTSPNHRTLSTDSNTNAATKGTASTQDQLEPPRQVPEEQALSYQNNVHFREIDYSRGKTSPSSSISSHSPLSDTPERVANADPVRALTKRNLDLHNREQARAEAGELGNLEGRMVKGWTRDVVAERK